MAVPHNCPLLLLPAELRLNIYEHALAPGAICLTITKDKRRVVVPRVSPALLSTCRRIYHEAKDLLCKENEITFTADAHDTCWPTIPECRLPQPVLERLQHVCVLLDCTGTMQASYDDADFTAFEALISLKTLRIGSVHTALLMGLDHWQSVLYSAALLTQVLMPDPRDTEVICHVEPGSHQDGLLQELLAKRRAGRRDPSDIVMAKYANMEAALGEVAMEVRGVKSGQTADVFAEYHDRPRTIPQRI